MKKTLEVIRSEDRTYQMLLDGELRNQAIPEKWLSDELSKLGFCGQEYSDIRAQLDKTSKAKVMFNDTFDMSKK